MPKLKREMGLFAATVYGVGVIVGAGIYVMVGEGAFFADKATWLAFLLTGIVAALTGLSYAELASSMPKAGSTFIYVKRAFRKWGRPLGFMVGWIIIFATIISAATVALGFGYYINSLFNINVVVSGVVLIVGLSLINFWSMKQSSRLNQTATFIEIGGLLFVIALALVVTNPEIAFVPATVFGGGGILTAAVLVFFAYTGFELIATSAEEVRNPEKTLPKALIISLVICILLYIGVSIAYTNLLSYDEIVIAKESQVGPISYATGKYLGSNANIGLSVVALFSTLNTALIMLIGASRIMYGIANGGGLPRRLARVHPRTHTPYIAVFAVGLFSIAAVLIGKIDVVGSAANLGAIIAFIFVNLSVLLLRHYEPRMKRPFRVPFSLRGQSVPALFGLISCIFMAGYICYVKPELILPTAGIIAVGAVLYKLTNR